MISMPITQEVIDELEARRIIRQDFQTMLNTYECFYHARHFVRANAMLSDLNFYSQILGLNLSLVLGRTDLDAFFISKDSDSLLMRIQNRIKTVSKPHQEIETDLKPFQTESQTTSNLNQGSESVSQIESKPFQTASIEVKKVGLEEIEQVFDKNATILVSPKPFQTVSKSEPETVSNPHQIRIRTEIASLPNRIKSVSKHDAITCPNSQKEIKNRRSNQFYCDKVCKRQYNNKQRKAA